MEFLSVGHIEFIWATLLLCAILFLCGRMGGATLGLLGMWTKAFTPAESRLFSLAIGLIILSTAVLVVGLLGYLNPRALVCLLLLAAIVSFASRRNNLFSFSGMNFVLHPRQGRLLFWAIVAGIMGMSWLAALMPTTGMDALSYHSYHPRQFVLSGRIDYLPFTRESLWPYLTEMLFTVGLLLQGVVLMQLFHWVFYGLTCWAVYTFTRRHYNTKTASLAALIFLFTPAAFAQSGHPYVDLSLAFYVFLAVYMLSLAPVLGEGKAAFLSGIFCGGALSTKYLALGAAGVLFLLWAYQARGRVKPLLIFLFCCLAISGVWYIRSWLLLGNPVYPFFSKYFGGNGYEADMMAGVGKGKGPLSFLMFGWDIMMHPYAFGGEMIGPLFLLFGPFLLFKVRGSRQNMLLIAIFTALYTLFLFTQSQQARFYISVSTFLSVGAAVAFCRILDGGALIRRAALLFFASTLLIHSGIFVYRLRTALPLLLGRRSAVEHLEIFERSFRGYEFLRARMKDGERLFNAGEARYFYGPAKGMVIDTVPLRQHLAKEGIDLSEYLKRERFEYIWVSDQSSPDVTDFLRQNSTYQEVFFYDFTEIPHTFHHRIFQRQK